MDLINKLVLASDSRETLRDIAYVFRKELAQLSMAAQHKILLMVFGDGRTKREYNWEKEAYAVLIEHEKSEALPPPIIPLGGGTE